MRFDGIVKNNLYSLDEYKRDEYNHVQFMIILLYYTHLYKTRGKSYSVFTIYKGKIQFFVDLIDKQCISFDRF
ncbi:hypothetical protein FXW25_03725 [Candidatus Liberibacter asiaticus]|nr:hypothetical protein FXW25_03725 [Candidatus Liberibacter asiaticus]